MHARVTWRTPFASGRMKSSVPASFGSAYMRPLTVTGLRVLTLRDVAKEQKTNVNGMNAPRGWCS